MSVALTGSQDITSLGGNTTFTVTFTPPTNGLLNSSTVSISSPGTSISGAQGNYSVTLPTLSQTVSSAGDTSAKTWDFILTHNSSAACFGQATFPVLTVTFEKDDGSGNSAGQDTVTTSATTFQLATGTTYTDTAANLITVFGSGTPTNYKLTANDTGSTTTNPNASNGLLTFKKIKVGNGGSLTFSNLANVGGGSFNDTDQLFNGSAESGSVAPTFSNNVIVTDFSNTVSVANLNTLYGRTNVKRIDTTQSTLSGTAADYVTLKDDVDSGTADKINLKSNPTITFSDAVNTTTHGDAITTLAQKTSGNFTFSGAFNVNNAYTINTTTNSAQNYTISGALSISANLEIPNGYSGVFKASSTTTQTGGTVDIAGA